MIERSEASVCVRRVGDQQVLRRLPAARSAAVIARAPGSSPRTSVPVALWTLRAMSSTVAGIVASSSGAAGLTVSSAAPDGDAPASDGSPRPGSGVPTATWPPSPPSALSYADAIASTSDGWRRPTRRGRRRRRRGGAGGSRVARVGRAERLVAQVVARGHGLARGRRGVGGARHGVGGALVEAGDRRVHHAPARRWRPAGSGPRNVICLRSTSYWLALIDQSGGRSAALGVVSQARVLAGAAGGRHEAPGGQAERDQRRHHGDHRDRARRARGLGQLRPLVGRPGPGRCGPGLGARRSGGAHPGTGCPVWMSVA